MRPQLNFIRYRTLFNSLGICVANNKINAFNLLIKHEINGVTSTASHTKNFDNGGFLSGEIKMYHTELI